MNAATASLSLATAVTALATVALAGLAWRARRPRGTGHWVAGLLCVALALALGAAVPAGGWPPVLAAQAMLLAWPMLTLAGLRRFHARIRWPTSATIDHAVFGTCAALMLSGPLWPAEAALGPLAAPIALLVADLYVASLVLSAASRPEGPPMRLLAAVLAAAALAPVLLSRPEMEAPATFLRLALAAAVAALAFVFVAMVLVFDRRERQWRASRRRLRMLAHIDALTRVPNRRRFDELASRAIAHDAPGSAVLLMFDIDHFKHINDQLGHAAGDRALRLVSHCLTQALRAQDVPGRHGGDEFALLLRNASLREGMSVAERLVTRLQAASRGSQLPDISLSFGIVQVRPVESLDEAARRADQALYEAKRQGRSRAVAATGNEFEPVFSESQRLGLTAA